MITLEAPLTRFYIGIGSNIDRQRHIRDGIAQLDEQFGLVDLSCVYESPSVGFDGEPFLNLVAGTSTQCCLEEVTVALRDIELSCGRKRGEQKFAPRTLDLDLLTWGGEVIDLPKLQLPRDEILHHAFVLRPLAELAPQDRHAVTGETFAAMWAQREHDMKPALVRRDVELRTHGNKH